MKSFRPLLIALGLVLAFAFASSASAAYNPSLALPANGATLVPPDGTTFSWTAGSDAPDHYVIQWSKYADFSELIFEYTTTATSYQVYGLPGLMKIYWRVFAVDAGGTQYASLSTNSFTSGADGETGTGTYTYITKVDFQDNKNPPTGWTNSDTGRLYYYTYSGNTHIRNYTPGSYYANQHYYLTLNDPITFDRPEPTISYDWGHYYYSSYTENLKIEYATSSSGPWIVIYDHVANNNINYWVSGSQYSYPTGWKSESHSLNALVGQTVYIRFHWDMGTQPQYSIFVDNIEIKGKSGYVGSMRNLQVVSPWGLPTPSGTVSYSYGSQLAASMNGTYHYPGGSTSERYVLSHFVGTGSIPTYGTSTSVTTRIYRTSTITWYWKHEYRFEVSSPMDRGAPTWLGVNWFPEGGSATFTITEPIVAGIVEGTRWVCSGWTGTGDVPGQGSLTTVIILSVSKASSLLWNWAIQYRLLVINPPGADIGNIIPAAGEYWHAPNTNVNISADGFDDTGTGVAWRNLGWIGTGSITSSSLTSGSGVVTQPSTITWVWARQVFLTINSQFGRATGNPPGWYEQGATVSLGASWPYNQSSSVRYVITGWTGTGSIPNGTGDATGSIVLNDPSSITWTWQKQYLVSFTSEYGTVDPVTAWVNDGANVSATANHPGDTDDSRFTWAGWTGPGLATPTGSETNSFNITASATFTANWTSLFYLDASPINGTLAGGFTGGWYNKFDVVSITAIPPDPADGVRYVPGWEGTGNGSVDHPALATTPTTVEVTMLSPIVQQSFWVYQYRFVIANPRGFGTPVPAAGEYWYFDGETVEGSIDYFSGTHICTGFTGMGSLASSQQTYYRFVITSPSSVSFIWDNPGVSAPDTWTAPQQVTSEVFGRSAALQRQSDGSPFIVFHNPVTGTLESAYWSEDAWQKSRIDTVGTDHVSFSFILDTYGAGYVCYEDHDDARFKFATFGTDGWTVTTIATGEGLGAASSMAIAGDGTIGISWYDLMEGDLYFTSFTPVADPLKTDMAIVWNTVDVLKAGNVGMFSSIQFTEFWNEPRIAFYNSTDGAVYIASWFRGDAGWTIDRVTPTGSDMGFNVTLGLDKAGKALMVFQNNTLTTNDQGLVYARELPAGWQVYGLSSEGITGFDSVMAVDEYGYPHVAYNDFGSLYYARYNGEGWTIQTVDTGEVSYGGSIALDDNGNAAIAYWNSGILKYADVGENHFAEKIVNLFTEVRTDDSTVVTTGGGGGCFIATASFASMADSSVRSLCAVRDSSLSASICGNALVGCYYAVSPAVADEASESALRGLLRRLLGSM